MPDSPSRPASNARRNAQLTRAGLGVCGLVLLGFGVYFIAVPGTAGVTRTVTMGTSPDTTVLTYPGHTARASDALIVFLLGTGLGLSIVCVLYDRIKTLTIGGVGITLSPDASAKLADQIKSRVQDPQQFEQAYRIAQASLAADYWGRLANPPDAALKVAADTATAVVSTRDERD